MSQPVWKTIYNTDHSLLKEDTTGVYPPELEIAQEYEDESARGGRRTKFMLYQVPLERQKLVPHEKVEGKYYLVPFKWDPSWSHPVKNYEEWFVKDLKSVAQSMGTSLEELVDALCSDDPKDLAFAYEAIGGHHGYDNFDSSPIILTENKLNKRWA